MVYKVIGLMSGSSLDGLDIAYVHLQEVFSTQKDSPRKWEYSLVHTICYPYSSEWKERLAGAIRLPALDYQLLHADYGHFLGEQVCRFIREFGLDYQVQLISSHGHTTFHDPSRRMTAQLGDGAALAAETGINVVSDLRAMDMALGGQGAPIVPMGERYLFPGETLFLNLGGIANISAHRPGGFAAFDVCPANRILNGLAAADGSGREYDAGGELAAAGVVNEELLSRLNALDYYRQAFPKSLANEFGTETILPLIKKSGLSVQDSLRTYVEHIAVQVRDSVAQVTVAGGASADHVGAYEEAAGAVAGSRRVLVTGGGAHNLFLISRLRALLEPLAVEVVAAAPELADYKEALVMALLGVLRWREEHTVLSSVTGASRDSIGGAVWIGQEG